MALILLIIGIVWLALTGWLLRRKSEVGRDLGAGGLLLLAVLAYFWRTLSGDVYQPADGGDLVSFLFPTWRFAAGQLAQGALPLWNPHLYGGAPFISDIQAGFLYLPHLLLFLAWPEFPYITLQWSAVLHLYWAGLGMYVLLRTLRWSFGTLSRPAAFLGGLAFLFSDPLLVHLGNLNLIAVLSWLPWILAAFARALGHGATMPQSRGASVGWAIAAGVLFGVGNYGGHAQSSLYVGMALALFALFSASMHTGYGRMGRALVQNLSYLVVAGGLALLLTAPILLPSWEMSGYSTRSEFTYQESIAFSLAPTQAIGLVTPAFFGRGPALHWSLWDRVETPYAGVATLLLAIGALVLAAKDDRRRLWIWVGIAVFGFLTALGVYALLHGWLAWAFPPFGQLRAPARALILWTLGLSVLAAYGLDGARVQVARARLNMTPGVQAWLGFLRGGAFVWIGIVLPLVYLALLLTQTDEVAFLRASLAALALCVAAGLWIGFWLLVLGYRAGWFGPRLFTGLVIGLLYMDLAATGAYTDISESDPTVGFQHPEVVAFLQADGDLFRIDTRTGMDHLWQPDAAALHGLQDVGGIANPLLLQHWRDFWESTGGRQMGQYDLLNVKYVLVEGETPLPEDKFVRVFDAPTGITIYENRDFWPRAWVVGGRARVSDLEAARVAFSEGTVDPRSSVMLEAGAAAEMTLEDAAGSTGSARVLHYGSSELTLEVAAEQAGYVVLSEVWYPGWHATVNGAATPVLRANFAQRAVAIPAGESTVHLWFQPRLWLMGLGLAAVGVFLAGGVGLLIYRTKK